MSDKVAAGMAVLPERQHEAQKVLKHIVPQLDEIWIVTGPKIRSGQLDYDIEKGGCKINYIQHLGRDDDARKFLGLRHMKEEGYYFTLDDDLIYPPDYVELMVRYLKGWNKEVIACVHGSWIEELPCSSYYKDKKAVHFAQRFDNTIQVMFPGTGTTAFHTSAIRPVMGDFPIPNIADVQLGIAAQQANIPVLAVPRPFKWVRQHPDINAMQDSIWARRKDNDSTETKLINRYESRVGWTYPNLP